MTYRTLTSGELNRLRHVCREQANTAQASGSDTYLHLTRFDAADVECALEELVALRAQQEDMVRQETEQKEIVLTRLDDVYALEGSISTAVEDLFAAVHRLREAIDEA